MTSLSTYTSDTPRKHNLSLWFKEITNGDLAWGGLWLEKSKIASISHRTSAQHVTSSPQPHDCPLGAAQRPQVEMWVSLFLPGQQRGLAYFLEQESSPQTFQGHQSLEIK